MKEEEIKKAFEKFYAESPAVGRTLTREEVKMFMWGSYMAGYILLGQELKKHL